jgi:hypothetical protein
VRAAERLFPNRMPAHSRLADAVDHQLHPEHTPDGHNDADPAP